MPSKKGSKKTMKAGKSTAKMSVAFAGGSKGGGFAGGSKGGGPAGGTKGGGSAGGTKG